MSIIVVGHRNPDTDSVISAIAFAELLRRKGMSVTPARAGAIQPETRIVFEKTGLGV